MKFIDAKKKFEENGKNWNECKFELLTYIPFESKVNSITDKLLEQVTEVKNNYMVIHTLNYELLVMNILCMFYCNIEFSKTGISTIDFDFLYQNNFKEWLNEATSEDSILFISYFKKELQDKVDAYNSFANVILNANSAGALDIEGLTKSIEGLKDIDPNSLDILKKYKAIIDDKKTEVVKKVK